MNKNHLYIFILLILLTSCKQPVKSKYFEIDINNGWMFRTFADSAWLNAEVPGNSINDLVLHNLAATPSNPDQIENLQQFFRSDWEYKTTFDIPREILEQDSVFLQFDGIAGNADVYINNTLCFRVNNMFLGYRHQCKNMLREFSNEIKIHFKNNPNPSSNKGLSLTDFRKPSFLNGSEINPPIPYQGIWKPVKLIAYSETVISQVYFETLSVSPENALIEVTLITESTQTSSYSVAFEINEQPQNQRFTIDVKPGKQQYQFNFTISRPELWWCNGMGKQALYNARTILYKQELPVFEKYNTFGIRKIEKIEQTDSIGYNFYFKLNNKPVFIKGGAWVPTDLYNAGTITDKYEQVIVKARDANMNLLRVWGGGFYESDRFYEMCDKYGIMVWQDIPLSTHAITGKQFQQQAIKEEIAQNIARLQNHPSLICLFANPDIDTYAGFKQVKNNFRPDTLVLQYFEKELPLHLGKTCKIPYYTPPFGEKTQSIVRDWRVWYDAAPLSAYNETPDGFQLEYGMQSLPEQNYLNINTPSNEEDVIPAAADNYQFCNLPWLGPDMNGNKLMWDYLQMYYNTPADYPMAVYLSQLFQAETLKTAIETHRLRKPFIMGTVFWHFNDCWPGITWSVTDYYNHPKPAYFAIKNAFKNVIIVPERMYGDIRVWLVNDSAGMFDGECNISLYHFSGKMLYHKTVKTQVPADQTQILWLINEKNLYKENHANKIFLNLQITRYGQVVDEKFVYFTEPRFLDLPVPDITSTIENYNTTRYKIKLTTSYFAKNVQLSVSGAYVHFSDNYFDMIPGRTYEITTDFTGRKEELENNLKINSLIDSY